MGCRWQYLGKVRGDYLFVDYADLKPHLLSLWGGGSRGYRLYVDGSQVTDGSAIGMSEHSVVSGYVGESNYDEFMNPRRSFPGQFSVVHSQDLVCKLYDYKRVLVENAALRGITDRRFLLVRVYDDFLEDNWWYGFYKETYPVECFVLKVFSCYRPVERYLLPQGYSYFMNDHKLIRYKTLREIMFGNV